MADPKLQIALYWGAACGGCDVAVLDTDAFILDLAAVADIRFWPIAVDGKYADVEAMADDELDLAIFNGAVRNSENQQVAELLRRKAKILVAFGSCAHLGGIPGLANQASRDWNGIPLMLLEGTHNLGADQPLTAHLKHQLDFDLACIGHHRKTRRSSRCRAEHVYVPTAGEGLSKTGAAHA